MKIRNYICKFFDTENNGYVSVLDVLIGVLEIGVIVIIPYLVYYSIPIWQKVRGETPLFMGASTLEVVGFITSLILIVVFLWYMALAIKILLYKSSKIKVITCKRK